MTDEQQHESSVAPPHSAEKFRDASLFEALKGFILCCYILCPPTPNCIVRKLAFHPPKKGSYSAYTESTPDVQVTTAAKLVGQNFRISPKPLSSRCTSADCAEVASNVECTALCTGRGNYIIAVKGSPITPCTENKIKEVVVIFSQPNASDLGEYLQPSRMNIPTMAELLGTDVYAFDYSGYGLSTGKPSEKNIYSDIRAVYEFVLEKRSDKKIVLLGYSLGTAAVSDLAASNPKGVVGVVLVAPFTSGLRLYNGQPEKETTSKLDRFITIEKVARIKVPLLVCHGRRDDAISVEHGLEIEKRAPRAVPSLILPEANHLTVFTAKCPETFKRIRKFLAEETDLQSAECVESGG